MLLTNRTTNPAVLSMNKSLQCFDHIIDSSIKTVKFHKLVIIFRVKVLPFTKLLSIHLTRRGGQNIYTGVNQISLKEDELNHGQSHKNWPQGTEVMGLKWREESQHEGWLWHKEASAGRVNHAINEGHWQPRKPTNASMQCDHGSIGAR